MQAAATNAYELTLILTPNLPLLLFLETICAVDRNAVLIVIAQEDVRLFGCALIADPEGDVRRQLIAECNCAAESLKMFVEKAARFIGIFVEKLSRKKRAADQIPSQRVPNKIQGDVIGIHTQLILVSGAHRLAELRVDPVTDQAVDVVTRKILVIRKCDREGTHPQGQKIVSEIDPLITAGHSNLQIVC